MRNGKYLHFRTVRQVYDDPEPEPEPSSEGDSADKPARPSGPVTRQAAAAGLYSAHNTGLVGPASPTN